MVRIKHRDRFLWAGVHERKGSFIYDPSFQHRVPRDQVCLYLVNEKRFAKFKRAIIRKRLVQELDSGTQRSLRELISHYIDDKLSSLTPTPKSLAGRKRFRSTHCYACQQHLNSDKNTKCEGCGWLICNCGACGCPYASFR